MVINELLEKLEYSCCQVIANDVVRMVKIEILDPSCELIQWPLNVITNWMERNGLTIRDI